MNKQSGHYVQANDFIMALKEMGTIIDVSVDDLMKFHQETKKLISVHDEESITIEQLKNAYLMALKKMDTVIDVTIEDLILLDQKAEKYARIRYKESILVEKLMTCPVKTIQSDSSLSDAAHLLVTHKISGLPVVDGNNKLVGIITEADFLHALGAPTHKPSHNVWQALENMFASPPQALESEGLVSDLMNKNVITITPKQSLHEAISVMKTNHIKRIVVCDEAHQIVGIITRSDLVRMFFDHFKPINKK